MNTILAGSSGALTVYLIKGRIFKRYAFARGYIIIDVCCGLLSALVSITAGCNVVAHWAALIIGVIGGIVYVLSCVILIKYKIDDPVEAT